MLRPNFEPGQISGQRRLEVEPSFLVELEGGESGERLADRAELEVRRPGHWRSRIEVRQPEGLRGNDALSVGHCHCVAGKALHGEQLLDVGAENLYGHDGRS